MPRPKPLSISRCATLYAEKRIMNLYFKNLVVVITCFSCFAVASDDPTYLKHRSDYVQRVYSDVLIGFAFERKCNYLEKSAQVDFEKHLNVASNIFQGYILAKEYVLGPAEALSYTKEMALGSIRYSAQSMCDTSAEKRIDLGFETAKSFLSLINGELEKEAE